ncbi:hypothetical protein JX265_003689 [Neoarthrinium moseri]|uniref:Uncharacterized protein n=1 Tax=Neoarthrinium moseri TaxID=1658444 RepID=A0A9P9WSN7_9PEZI|nr:hypothetical protein JX266_001129 [Neoarthrinium moseri]KAI1877681.1 hypothetical protein JX265_003689 [Neoarthrinium moseri]
MTAPHPQMPGFQSAGVPNVRRAAGPLSRSLPTLAAIGAVAAVATYVRSQLSTSKSTYNKIFAQQNTPEVEEARRRQLMVETNGDPRRTLFNILGW